MPATLFDPELPAALESRGLTAPLDLPENTDNLHEAIALANGTPPAEAFEWLAAKFGLLPYVATRPAISVQTEATYRNLAAGRHDRAEEAWIPVGTVGPLLIMGHYSPSAANCWRIPQAFTIRVLLTQRQYNEYQAILAERLQAKPLVPRSEPVAPRPLTPEPSPETALKWLLSEYPFREEERNRLEGCLEPLSAVAANHVIGLKSLPPGFGTALRHLCTGEAVFNAGLAPRQSEFPDTMLEKHAVFPLYVGHQTVYLLSSAKEIFAFEDEWLASNTDDRTFRPVLCDKESILRVVNRDRSNATAASSGAAVGELMESGAANIVDIDPQEMARVNPASINTTAEQALHWVFHRSITARASDLHIEKYFNMARFRARIDGELVTLFSARKKCSRATSA